MRPSRSPIDLGVNVAATVCDKPAGAGINLQAIYVTGVEEGLVELAIVSDDPKKTKKLLD